MINRPRICAFESKCHRNHVNRPHSRPQVHSKLRNGGAKGRACRATVAGPAGATLASTSSASGSGGGSGGTTILTGSATPSAGIGSNIAGGTSSQHSSSSASSGNNTVSNTPSTSPTTFLPPRPEKRKSKDDCGTGGTGSTNGAGGGGSGSSGGIGLSELCETKSLINPLTGLNVQIPTKKCKSTALPCPISPVLLECPEQDCSKKYKFANGLKYHQSHAHGLVMLDEDLLQTPGSPQAIVPPLSCTTPTPPMAAGSAAVVTAAADGAPQSATATPAAAVPSVVATDSCTAGAASQTGLLVAGSTATAPGVPAKTISITTNSSGSSSATAAAAAAHPNVVPITSIASPKLPDSVAISTNLTGTAPSGAAADSSSVSSVASQPDNAAVTTAAATEQPHQQQSPIAASSALHPAVVLSTAGGSITTGVSGSLAHAVPSPSVAVSSGLPQPIGGSTNTVPVVVGGGVGPEHVSPSSHHVNVVGAQFLNTGGPPPTNISQTPTRPDAIGKSM